MSENCHLAVVSRRFGRGFVCFFDEPFGEQTPFESAGGYSAVFDCGVNEAGPIQYAEAVDGIDAWLVKQGWQRLEEIEALVEI